jgi:hypothetical protein
MLEFLKNKSSKTIDTPLEDVKMKIKVSTEPTKLFNDPVTKSKQAPTRSVDAPITTQFKVSGKKVYIEIVTKEQIKNAYLKIAGYSRRTNNYVYEYIGSVEPAKALKGISYTCRLIPEAEIKFL